MRPRILVVRLGAMGDLIHTLPAVATLRRNCPDGHITWLVEPRWFPLIEGNPHVDAVAPFDRAGGLLGMYRSATRLRQGGFDLGLDFQGLIKSAAAMWLAGAPERWGRAHPREAAARWFYRRSAEVEMPGRHVVDQHIALVQAAFGRTTAAVHEFPLPSGHDEGAPDRTSLPPDGRYVLTCPLAGWGSKQWPGERYSELAAEIQTRLGWPLVLNLPAGVEWSRSHPNLRLHRSGLHGLIHATRRAGAVVGLDSGPLHLAAALGKPGVAIYGPTDPARNGPYGGTIRVIRTAGAETSYRRRAEPAAEMRQVTAGAVADELAMALTGQA